MSVLALPAPRRIDGRSEATRRLIVSAGIDAFASGGFDATRLVAIARASWVAPSTVSMHFHGKADLYEACLREEADRVQARTRSALHGHPYPHLSGDFARGLQRESGRSALLMDVVGSAWATWGGTVVDEFDVDRLVREIQHEVQDVSAREPASGAQSLASSAPCIAQLTVLGLVTARGSLTAGPASHSPASHSPVAGLMRAALVGDGCWEAVARASALWRARTVQHA